MRALGSLPFAGTHEDFAVARALLAMKFVNRHEEIIIGPGKSQAASGARFRLFFQPPTTNLPRMTQLQRAIEDSIAGAPRTGGPGGTAGPGDKNDPGLPDLRPQAAHLRQRRQRLRRHASGHRISLPLPGRPPAVSGHFPHRQRRAHDRHLQRLSTPTKYLRGRSGAWPHRATCSSPSPPAANPKTSGARWRKPGAGASKASVSSAATAGSPKAWPRSICWWPATTPRGSRKVTNCCSTRSAKPSRKNCRNSKGRRQNEECRKRPGGANEEFCPPNN